MHESRLALTMDGFQPETKGNLFQEFVRFEGGVRDHRDRCVRGRSRRSDCTAVVLPVPTSPVRRRNASRLSMAYRKWARASRYSWLS